MPRNLGSWAISAVGWLALAGCVNDSTAQKPGVDGAPTPLPSESPALVPGCVTLSPGPSPLRRLTRFEYNNTARDLLQDKSAPADRFPPEEESLGFDNDANVLRVPLLLAEGYLGAAQSLGEGALSDFPGQVGCDPAVLAGEVAKERACAEAFVTNFGERSFRRPVSAEEQTRLLELYETARGELGFTDAIRTLLETMLMSPQFLYRVESGTPVPGQPDVEAVDSWGVASRLSYFLWGSLPDATLFEAARAGALTRRAQVRAQAERMYADARTHEVVRHFHDYWLGLLDVESQGKDPALFPDYSPQIGSLMRRQTQAFAEHVFFEAQGDLRGLLTAPYTFMNQPLAQYFGVTGPTGEEFARVELDPTRYAGLVTQPSILSWYATSNRTHPILRGKFIRERLLCSSPPPPPDNVIDSRDKVANPNATERERLSQHRADPNCAGCHTLMDPIGFGFENFDASGRWRDTEGGLPVDASGEIVGADVAGAFNGPVELASKLAGSKQVEACVVAQWFRFASGRAESEQDACGTAWLAEEFQAKGQNLRELVLAITQMDSFLYRTSLVNPENTP